MNINAIDTALSDAALAEVKTKISDAKQLMPFLVTLSAKERQAAFKMSRKRFDFVSKVIVACQNEPLVMPHWVDLDDLQKDYTLSNQLLGIESMLESLLIDVKNSRMQLGSEALKSAVDVYAFVQQSKDRVPGMQAIFDSLRASYPGRGKNKKKSE